MTLDELLVDLKNRQDAGAQVAIGRLEVMFLAADGDGDRRLSLAEYRAGHEQSAQGRRQTSNLSREVARGGEPQESNTRFWGLIVINVLLVGGVAWYALFP